MEVREVNMYSMFNNFNQTFSTFNIIFIITSIFIGLVFIFVILSIVNPKFRAKLMSRQIRATKQMIDYSKDDLKDIVDMEADIKKGYVKTMAKSIKEGLTEENTIYCKHCGSMIDSDSRFCKKCGKEQ